MNRLTALVALLVVAAGSGAATAAHGAASPGAVAAASPAAVASASPAAVASASPAAVARAWSKALNANRNVEAAKLFARNARVVQPGIDARLTSRALAIAFNASLPCAGRVVAVTVTGNRAVATFVLGERPKHHCDAPGVKAAALFVVRGGKIVLWQQVAVPNPDSGQPTA